MIKRLLQTLGILKPDPVWYLLKPSTGQTAVTNDSYLRDCYRAAGFFIVSKESCELAREEQQRKEAIRRSFR